MEYKFKEYSKSELISDHLKMSGTDSRGEKIEINSLYFMKSGIPWIGVMGEYHFARADKADWYRELCKMKAGGISIVSTYVFWIYHEEEEGIFDFSGNNDIRTFFEYAQDIGLEICLRLGPWINGECRNGGFPDWLQQKDCVKRSNDPKYLELVERYWRRLYEEVKGISFLAIQIENELVDNAEHIAGLKRMAMDIGYTAPIFTATGWNAAGGAKLPIDEVVPVFGGYPEAPWERHKNRMEPSKHFFFHKMRNDAAIGADLMVCGSEDGWRLPYERYPFATCEMGGGVQIGHHRRPIINSMDIYAISLVKLGCGNNLIGYYMYHGGTHGIGKLSTFNVGYCPIRNYDFQAPISQYGEIREHYRLLNLLNMFVSDFGSMLAPMEMVESENMVARYDTESLRYCMRTDGEGGFVFINHYQRLDKLEDIYGAVLNVGNMVFPEMDIRGEICFFLPFNLKLGTSVLEYATAQPLCIVDDTYFFVEIEGINPVYKFSGKEARKCQAGMNSMFREAGIKVVTLSRSQACSARKIGGKLYIGEADGRTEDLFEEKGKIIAASGNSEFAFYIWDGCEFMYRTSDAKPDDFSSENVKMIREACEKPFDLPEEYERYLHINHRRKVDWYRIKTDTAAGFVEIEDIFDVAQIYADGELAADQFYYGKPWRIPAKLLYNKECYLAVSQIDDDFYREFGTSGKPEEWICSL